MKVYLVPRAEVVRSEPAPRPQTPECAGQGKRAEPQSKRQEAALFFPSGSGHVRSFKRELKESKAIRGDIATVFCK